MPDTPRAPEALTQYVENPTRRNDTSQFPALGHNAFDLRQPQPPMPAPVPPKQPRPPKQRANGKGKATGYAIKILGLVAIAVVSGFIWWVLQPKAQSGNPTPQHQPQQASEFTFDKQQTVDPTSDCAAHSYKEVKAFFAENHCKNLERWLYTTKAKNGDKVVVSVAKVTMPDKTKATDLKAKTDADDTGNVNDVLREGARVPGGPAKMNNAGYKSEQRGEVIVIAESMFYDGHEDTDLLKKISAEALRLVP